jgi:hypothetical protein
MGDALSSRLGRVPLWALTLLCAAGCVARYVRIAEKDLTCVEAHHVAIEAVQRMGYTITEATKALPGAPGMIIATREIGTEKRGLVVQVFCTARGAEVEAKTDQGGIAQLSFASEFRRNFEIAVANRPPPRPAAKTGVDVLVSPDRGEGLGSLGIALMNAGVLPVTVRITNHTPRAYRFAAAGVELQTGDGERVHPTSVARVASGLDAEGARTLREKVLSDRRVPPNETLTGVLLFPFKSYTRARVELTDLATGETEGFSVDF